MIGSVVQLLKQAGRCSLLGSALILMPISAIACGLKWSKPRSHFEGVSSQGYVFLVEDIDKFDVGSGLTLPLRAIFRSESNTISPYAGLGWDIPLLESRIVQLDERSFRMVEPTGWYRLFWRDEKNPNILHGQNGWKGEIKGNQIVAWAECGSKLVFHKGRITSMQLKDRRFDYLYKDGRVESITEAGATIVKVESEVIGGAVTGFRMAGNNRVKIEWAQRPRVRAVDNQNLVAGMEQSLGKITYNNVVNVFEYSVDQKANPTIKRGDRVLTWDPKSNRILKDGEWDYQITPHIEHGPGIHMERKNTGGQSEFWEYDLAHSFEKVKYISGRTTEKKWFTTGKLWGKLRAINCQSPSGEKIFCKYTYDESSKLKRISKQYSSGWMEVERFNDDGSSIISESKDGIEKFLRFKNKEGSIYATQSK